jgi:hypothetical protein
MYMGGDFTDWRGWSATALARIDLALWLFLVEHHLSGEPDAAVRVML